VLSRSRQSRNVSGPVGAAFFLWFMGSLYGHFRRAEGEPGRVWAIAMGAGVWTLGVFLVEGALYTALAYKIAGEGDSRITQAVWDIAGVAATFRGYTVGILFVAIAVAVLRTGVMSRWIGTSALVLGLLQLVRGARRVREQRSVRPVGRLLGDRVRAGRDLGAGDEHRADAAPRSKSGAGSDRGSVPFKAELEKPLTLARVIRPLRSGHPWPTALPTPAR
jgi:hypothetical protein